MLTGDPTRGSAADTLPGQYWNWANTALDDTGFGLPTALVKDADAKLTVLAMDLEPDQVYHAVLAACVRSSAVEAIFALDRFAKSGQGTRLNDLLGGHYFDGTSWMPFIIEYQVKPRLLAPIDWINSFWNQALRAEMLGSVRSLMASAGGTR